MRSNLRLRHLNLPLAILLTSLAAPARADETAAAPAPAAAAPAPEPVRPRILILPYRVAEGTPVDADTANAILSARMGKLSYFHVVSQQELASLVGYEAMLQGLGASNDEQALVKLGEAAQADKLVSGTLGDVGGATVATLTLLDVKNATVEKRAAGTAKGGRDLVIPMLNQQADTLLAHLLRTYAADKVGSARAAPAPAPAPAASEVRGGPSGMAWVGIGLLGGGLGLGGMGASAAATAALLFAGSAVAGVELLRGDGRYLAVLHAVLMGTGLCVAVLGVAIAATGGALLGRARGIE